MKTRLPQLPAGLLACRWGTTDVTVLSSSEDSAVVRLAEAPARLPDVTFYFYDSAARAGVTHLKIVGRGNYVGRMEADVKTARAALDRLESNCSDFHGFRALAGEACDHSCLFPPLREN